MLSTFQKVPSDLGVVIIAQVIQIFAVTGHPVDSGVVSGISQGFVQCPETTDETFCVLSNRLRKVRALRRYCADDGDRTFCVV